MTKMILLLLSIVLCLQQTFAATDETLVAKAKGQDVVEAVIIKISTSQIFSDDYDFLKRMALVETEFGNNATQYALGGGIWKLSEERYIRSKTAPSQFLTNVITTFNINWTTTTYADLLKPLYSGLATRLYIETFPNGENIIPQVLKDQADYWVNWFGTDKANSSMFIDPIKEWEEENQCNGKMDLLIVLDESGSIGAENFTKATQFVADLLDMYDLTTVREGFMTFASRLAHRIHFPIENKLTSQEIYMKVNNTSYNQGATYTNDAIKQAVQLYERTPERPGVPKILALFTDGQANDSPLTNVALAKAADLTTFAVGIGKFEGFESELEEIAYGDKNHVFKMTDFDALTEFSNRMNSLTCNIPQQPALNDTIEDSLKQNEKRFYQFTVPEEGMTIFVDTKEGSVVGYYSYTFPSPSSAMNDGMIDMDLGTFIPSPPTSFSDEGRILQRLFLKDSSPIVFLTVQGKGANSNKYEILADEGDLARDPPTTTTQAGFLSRPTGILIGLMSVLSLCKFLW